MSDDQYDHEAGTSRCNKKHFFEPRASTSNNMAAYKSSENMFQEESRRKADEIEQLEGRLRVLEEDAEMLKEVFFESMEERTKLISEINEHFNTLQNFLLQRQPNRGELYGHGVHIIISLLKERRRAGLLQILCQESNPSIITKVLRAN